MEDYFRKAKKNSRHQHRRLLPKFVAINGCCYGTTATEDRGDYLKLCGKNFWTLISGDEEFL